jgi:protocatechuate 3,4-dioxygenase beta subunit
MLDRSHAWILLAALLFAAPGQTTETAEELPFRVSGTVSAPGGEPVEGAEVWIRVADQTPWNKPRHDDWFEPVSATTNAQGRFAVSLPIEGPYRVLVTHPEHAPFGLLDDVTGGQPVDLAFGEPIALSGFVRDRTGRAVDGATVLACAGGARSFGAQGCLEARTHDEGRFGFSRLSRGKVQVQAVAPGTTWSAITEVRLPLDGQDVEGSPPVLTVGPGGEASGRVEDDAGAPLPGVQLSYATERVRLGHARNASDVQPLIAVVTDDDGAFVFHGLPAAIPLKLLAEPASRGLTESSVVTLEAGGAVGGVVLVYERPAGASVRLVDRDEQPVGELQVLWKTVTEKKEEASGLRPAGFPGPGKVEARGEGLFRISGVKPGRYDITLLPGGYREIVLEGVRLSPGAETDLGTHVARAGITLSGTVTDDLGEPIAGAKIGATYLKGNQAMSRSVESDEQGRFALGGLADKPLMWLNASADGHGAKQERNVVPNQRGYEIVLERAGSVSGEATLGDGGYPQRLVAVLEPTSEGLILSRRRSTQPAQGDERGRFEILGVEPGTYTLRLSAGGTRPLRVKDVVVLPGEPTDVGTHELERGRKLSGTVVDLRNGAPIAGAAVRVHAGAGAMLGDDETLGTAVTDADGRFSVGGLSEGTMEVRAEHADYAAGRETTTLSQDEPDERLTIRLGQGGLLRGTVRDETEQPSPGRSIGVTEGGSGFSTDNVVRTNDAGDYRVERLRPGAYRLMLYPEPGAASMNMQFKTATVREGEETVVDFDSGVEIAFSGRILRGGTPVGDVTVMLVPAADGAAGAGMLQMKSARVDGSGRFEVGLSGPGTYNVLVQDLERGVGALSGQARIVVPDEPLVSQEIFLEEGSISGRVSDEDDLPIEGSMVAASREGAPPGEFGTSTTAVVDAEGHYRLDGVGEGNYDVYAVAEGYEMARETVTVHGTGEVPNVNLRLVRAGELRGRVVDVQGHGIAGAFVFASPAGEADYAGAMPAETDAEGNFKVSAPRSGPCDLEAVARGHAPGRLNGYLPDPGNDGPGARITLTPGGRIEIRVVDADGRPVEGALPAVLPDVPSQALSIAFLFMPIPPTGAEGSATVANLPDGGYSVSLAGRPEVPAQTVSVSGAGTAVVTLQLP